MDDRTKSEETMCVDGRTGQQDTCLFAVTGNSRESRHRRIEAVARLEPSIGFLAAVFDFEWMVRRTILALSACPTPLIRAHFEKKHGWSSYEEAWQSYVRGGKKQHTPSLEQVLTDKGISRKAISDAFGLRHPLVHGANGFIADDMALFNMNLLLSASDALEMLLKSKGLTAFQPIKRMKCPCATGKSFYGLRKESRDRKRKLEERVRNRMVGKRSN